MKVLLVSALVSCLLLLVSAMSDDETNNLSIKEEKKTTKRGLPGLGYGGFSGGSHGFGFGASPSFGLNSGLYNAPQSFPSYFEQPAVVLAPQPVSFTNHEAISAAIAAKSYIAKQQAQTLANRAAANAAEVAAAIASAKEATAAAAAARENVQAAKDAVIAQQRIAAAKEAAAAAAIQRSEAAVNAAAAIEKSEAAAAAAAAIQQSALAAKAAVASAQAAKAAAATHAANLPHPGPGAVIPTTSGQYLAAKKAVEYGPWG